MASGLPEYDSPPVVETVLSAQFARLASFTLAHAGWFWKSYLDETWTSVVETSRINDVFETFGDQRAWTQQSIQLIPIGQEGATLRLQIARNDEERMIQVQDSRFIQNWRKRETGYPSYRKLLPEFRKNFESFQKFASDAKFGTIDVNQWEITYVNLLYRGELWESPGDWQALLPWFGSPPKGLQGGQQVLEGFANGEWRFVLGDNVGRLSVALSHVKIGSPAGKEALSLQLSARGPIQPSKGIDLYTGLDFGHEAIVKAFTAMTSEKAHKFWKRKA
jgi:uncharacterized protein (TIGR04255 family)